MLLITRRSGETVRIAESSLVAGKVVPPAPARRRGPAASYEELARVASRAWRPVESERLGEWELRAAAGFTRRANSVLPAGDPGVPLDEALTAVRRWYGERGLPAYVQTATGAEGTQEMLCAELERRGWVREVTAELWTGALAPLADRAEGAGVALSREAGEAWLARYRRKGVGEAALKVLGSGPSVWFATVPGAAGGAPAAIGRCVVDGRWAGFAAVEVDPEQRRRGLATAVMAALARQALDEGASAAWLQVETDNAGARALYAGMGFTPHHAYHHYREPAPDPSGEPGTDPGQADGPGTDLGREPDAGSHGEARTDPGREPDAGSHGEARTNPSREPDAGSHGEPRTNPGREPNPEPGSGPDTGSGPVPGRGTGAHPGGGPGTAFAPGAGPGTAPHGGPGGEPGPAPGAEAADGRVGRPSGPCASSGDSGPHGTSASPASAADCGPAGPRGRHGSHSAP